MMLSGANVLLLDEPTNHLDLESIASLNDGLIKYPETILFTSHDHQFVETVADRIIDVTPGHFFDEAITFDEYVEKHRSKMIKITINPNHIHTQGGMTNSFPLLQATRSCQKKKRNE